MPGFLAASTGPFAVLSLLLSAVLAPAAPSGIDQAEAERQAWIEAYARGMPMDSLYYLLAGQALGRLAYDTAMAFNLSIPTPAQGAFRDSVLVQRFRLYRVSGLHQDADHLRDSLPTLPERPSERRPAEWSVRIRSGFSGEDQGYARSYPSGLALPGTDTGGWFGGSEGSLFLPLPSPSRFPLSAGLGYELGKSYYKDSLDYRAGLELRADRIFAGFSAGVSAQAGRIAGLGAVAAWKGDWTWFSLAGTGYWVGHGGYETEWEGLRDKRYDAAWLSLLRAWELRPGWTLQGSFAGTLLLLDPFEVPGMNNVIFVDDVAKSAPVHYRDAGFGDTLPGGRAAYVLYTGAKDSLAFLCPQNSITLRQRASIGLPAGFGAKAELGMGYGFAFYPEAYAWKEDAGGEAAPGDTIDFRGYALNRADGRYYRAYLDRRNGDLAETYGTVPLRERRVRRMDHLLGADATLSRGLARWGEARLELGVERTLSNLSGEAPVWIPEWDFRAGIRWSMSGRWPR